METHQLPQPKKQDDNKLLEALKKHSITLLLSGLIVLWTFVKDTFNAGAELKFRAGITEIVKEDLKTYFDTIIDKRFDYNLKRSLDNPMIWYKALESDYVSEYAEEKSSEIREEVRNKLIEVDSIQKSFIESLGKELGIRDEDILPLFQNMMRDYVKKRSTHHVSASF